MATLGTAWIACVSGPPPSVVSAERDAAVRFALAGRAFAVTLAKQCRFDPETRTNLSSLAEAALAAWDRRNGDTVAAARRYVDDYLQVFARRSGRRAAADRERELQAEQAVDGARAADRLLGEAGGRDACPELLDRLGAGELDFADPVFEPVLAELREEYAVPAGG